MSTKKCFSCFVPLIAAVAALFLATASACGPAPVTPSIPHILIVANGAFEGTLANETLVVVANLKSDVPDAGEGSDGGPDATPADEPTPTPTSFRTEVKDLVAGNYKVAIRPTSPIFKQGTVERSVTLSPCPVAPATSADGGPDETPETTPDAGPTCPPVKVEFVFESATPAPPMGKVILQVLVDNQLTIASVQIKGNGVNKTLSTKAGEELMVELAPGWYGVVVSKEGYLSRTRDVEIKPWETKVLDFPLEKEVPKEADTLVNLGDFVLKVGTTFDLEGAFFRLNAEKVKTPIPGKEVLLETKEGASAVAIQPNANSLKLLLKATAPGTANLKWCWSKGTPETTDDLCSEFKVVVPPSP